MSYGASDRLGVLVEDEIRFAMNQIPFFDVFNRGYIALYAAPEYRTVYFLNSFLQPKVDHHAEFRQENHIAEGNLRRPEDGDGDGNG
ncbi:hypothetical protein JNB91_21010 [Rhizobium wenxiniae]|uniref:hypothetical protein n=1 Tax=Rhizobium wenxiniae TaxID=1737357 RepID=UPI001C6EBA80|nr:hypothetical protein [Rhizobium wenxiniae]MBW9090295.1 hypothetical protein [Rhizobium wenxiniae]